MIDRTKIKSALAAKPDCLSMQELERLAAAGSQNNPHLIACAHCQAELAMLKTFTSAAPLADEGAAVAWINNQLQQRLDQIRGGQGTVTDAPSWRNLIAWKSRLIGTASLRWLVPVSAVLLIVVSSFVLLRARKEPELRADAGAGPAVYRSQEVQVTGPSGMLAKAPATLQWKNVARAARYRVAMMEVDQVPFWESTSNYDSLTIPIEIRNRILPGKPISWRVTALDADGRVLAVSQLQQFSVERDR
jgi:hypothetical protein